MPYYTHVQHGEHNGVTNPDNGSCHKINALIVPSVMTVIFMDQKVARTKIEFRTGSPAREWSSRV